MANNSRKVQLAAELDASPVKAGAAQVKDAVADMARGVKTAADQAGKAMGDIPKGAEDAAGKIDRATRQIEASLQRTVAAGQAGAKGTAAYFEALAGQRGADVSKLQPLLAQLRQLEQAQKSVGVSAGQTSAALRQLPAQFTDIFTSLQGGQAPLTVFLQQGGQIKDSFGGIGNAVRGIAASINPAVVALGAAGAAVVALGTAYKQGSAEADEYRRSLVLTGNVAGTTVGQLQATAQALSATVGTQGKAAEALAALAATGRVASADLGKLAEAAIRLEREGGPAVEETVKQFAALGKDPLKASISLNETTNFLTLSVYKQIKALTDQGRAFEAAKVAQEAYANAGIERSKELERNLGTLERGWRGVKDAAKGAWDAILNIGRQDTLQQQLATAQAKLDELQASRTVGRNAGKRGTTFDAEEAALRRQIATLKENIQLQGRAAEASADRARAVQGAIAADEKADKAGKAANAEAEKRAALLAQLSGLESGYADDLKRLQELRRNGTLNEQRYVEAVEKLIQKQPFAREQERERAAAQREMTKALEDGEKARTKYLEGLDKQIAGADAEIEKMREEIALLEGGKGAREAVIQRRLDDAAAQAAQNLQAAEARGAGEAEYARLVLIADKLREVANERRRFATATDEKDFRDANAKAAADAAREWERTADGIRDSLTDAFRRAFESGEDFGTAMAKTLERELKARLATALAGALADGLLSLAGVVSSGGNGNNATTGTVLQGASLATNLAKLYGSGGTGSTLAAANYANVYSGSAYGTAFGSQQSAALAAQEAGMVNASTSSIAGYAGWAAVVYAALKRGMAEYDAGWTYEVGRDSKNAILGEDAIGQSFSKFSVDAVLTKLGTSMGLSDRWASILSGATAIAQLIGRQGPKVTEQGITGSIGAGDFTGQAYRDILEKGGLFRSDKRYTEMASVSGAIESMLDAGAADVLAKAKEYGAALGLPVESLAGVTQEFKIALTDDAAKNREAIVSALGGYGDALVKGFADAVAPLAAYGETTVQTIERVGGAIQSVNAVLGALGVQALAASVDGGKAALALQDLFGGVAGLQQAAGTYLQGYYTDAERAALTTKSLAQEFGRFGAAVPATREQFRELVSAQDLTTASGREAFAALMGVADAFATIVPAARSAESILQERLGLEQRLLQLQDNTTELRRRELEALDASNRPLLEQVFALEDQRTAAEAAADAARDAADAARDAADAQREAAEAQRALARSYDSLVNGLKGGVQSAFSTLTSTVQSERQRLQSQAEAQIAKLEQRAQRVQAAYGGLIDGLGSALQTLTGQALADGGRAAGASALQQGLAQLRAGKSTDLDALKQAAGNVARVDAGAFGSRLDYQREVAATAALLRDVQGAARAQMGKELASIARQQVAVERALDAQLATLDEQLNEARSSAESLVSIDDGVHSMADALAQLAEAIGALKAATGAGGPTGQWLTSGGSQVWAARGGAVASRQVGAGFEDTLIKGLSGQVFTAADAVAYAQDRIAAGDFAGLRDRAVREGIDSDALDALLQLKPGTALEEARRRGLPGFEAGTAYVPSTGVYVMHEGERVMTSADNAYLTQTLRNARAGGAAADAQLAELLSAVRGMDGRLYAALAQVASNTRRTADTQEDWDTNGMPETRPA